MMDSNLGIAVILIAGITLGFVGPDIIDELAPETENKVSEWRSQVQDKTPEKATFAGGCFWCIEEVYQGEKGIESAVSGFTGGKASTAEYRLVASGETEHREAVIVEYYPNLISYEQLLDIYWRSIDPTDPGGQFADRGFQYTTAIYAHNEKQYRLAKQSKQNLSESGKFEEPIVTEVKNFTEFYRAKDSQQNYSLRNTYQYQAYKRSSGRTGYIERVWK